MFEGFSTIFRALLFSFRSNYFGAHVTLMSACVCARISDRTRTVFIEMKKSSKPKPVEENETRALYLVHFSVNINIFRGC